MSRHPKGRKNSSETQPRTKNIGTMSVEVPKRHFASNVTEDIIKETYGRIMNTPDEKQNGQQPISHQRNRRKSRDSGPREKPDHRSNDLPRKSSTPSTRNRLRHQYSNDNSSEDDHSRENGKPSRIIKPYTHQVPTEPCRSYSAELIRQIELEPTPSKIYDVKPSVQNSEPERRKPSNSQTREQDSSRSRSPPRERSSSSEVVPQKPRPSTEKKNVNNNRDSSRQPIPNVHGEDQPVRETPTGDMNQRNVQILLNIGLPFDPRIPVKIEDRHEIPIPRKPTHVYDDQIPERPSDKDLPYNLDNAEKVILTIHSSSNPSKNGPSPSTRRSFRLVPMQNEDTSNQSINDGPGINPSTNRNDKLPSSTPRNQTIDNIYSTVTQHANETIGNSENGRHSSTRASTTSETSNDPDQSPQRQIDPVYSENSRPIIRPLVIAQEQTIEEPQEIVQPFETQFFSETNSQLTPTKSFLLPAINSSRTYVFESQPLSPDRPLYQSQSNRNFYLASAARNDSP